MVQALGEAARNPYTLAERLLGVMTGALDGGTPYTESAPVRRYVAHGAPVIDCPDQLTVNITEIRTLQAPGGSNGFAIGGQMILVDFVVTLMRCFPTGVVPMGNGNTRPLSVGEISPAIEQLLKDGWSVYHAAVFHWNECAGPRGGGCELYNVSPMRPVDPEGGSAGWQFTLTAEIAKPRKVLSPV
jgi:hypothetical protein